MNESLLLTVMRLGERIVDKLPLLPDFPNGGLVERDPDLGRRGEFAIAAEVLGIASRICRNSRSEVLTASS